MKVPHTSLLVSLFIILLPLFSLSARPGTQELRPDSVRADVHLIPTPRQIATGEGRFFFSSDFKIILGSAGDADDRFSASELVDEIQREMNFRPQIVRSVKGKFALIGQIGRDRRVQNELKSAGITVPESLGTEGYVLHITPSRILIAANSGTGVFYGAQTMKQLVRSNREGMSIPCVTIVDWPALRYRGWMDDISRGPIPTLSFMKEAIRKMAEVKQNFFTLYTEHVFKLKSHPEIAPAEGITAAEIAELTAFAKKYHIELIGNAQSFGHMENILRSPFYHTIRENSYVLTPGSEETYRFLKEVYAEIVPSYQSKFFHINCDEVSGLGTGPGRVLVDSLGVGGVYAYHISRINDIIKPYGKRLMMWGDIAAQNQDIIAKLPKDLIVISWGYHGAESFEDAILPFKKTGFEFMVAPGVSCWSQVWPDMTTAVINISNYVRDGAKLGAMGVMNTAWDDDGENFFTHNWHGLLWGAECSWRPAEPLTGEDADKNRDARLEQFDRAFDDLFYGVPGVTNALFQFDSLRHSPVQGLVTDYAVWSSMLDITQENMTGEARADNERAVDGANELLARLQDLKGRAARNAQTLDYALFAAKRVLFTAKKNLVRIDLARAMQSGTGEDILKVKGELENLLDTLHLLKSDYVGLWERENRSWWLDRILDKYDRLGNHLLDLDKLVIIEPENMVIDGRRPIKLRTPFNDQSVYYTTDGSEPTLRSCLYSGPFDIDRTSLVRAKVLVGAQPYRLSELPVMVHKAVGKLLRLNSQYSRYRPTYAAGGEMGLVDGLRGSDNFADGRWQGYQGQDLDIVLDLQKSTQINRITVGFLQSSYSWILMPAQLQIWTSDDGVKYTLAKEILNATDPREEGAIVHDFTANFTNFKARYVQVIAKNPGKLPAWHHAAGNDSYIFADEIIIE